MPKFIVRTTDGDGGEILLEADDHDHAREIVLNSGYIDDQVEIIVEVEE